MRTLLTTLARDHSRERKGTSPDNFMSTSWRPTQELVAERW